ncbi:hypothetical protein [Paraburkholderia sp. RL17-337-BIB-A]|uniref:hypothetical protein n=1 Tax=Paraburkholderia sp. RL17-337-BIB-A TaxID=3031636 RepID=UPI0038B9473F
MLALKLFLVPVLIAMVTFAGRWRGPALAGMLAGCPVVAAPVLLLVAIQYGPGFAVSATAGAMYAPLANASFCLGYAWAATRFPWWISLTGGLFSYAIAGGLLIGLTPSAYPTLFLTIPSLWLIWRSFPTNMELSATPSRSAGDLPARMIAGAVLVMVVTFAAPALGPRLSGILSGFPVLGCVLASSSHRVEGPEFVIRLLKGMVTGFYTMLFFIFTLAILLPEWGITHSFIMAFAIGTLIQIGTVGMKPFTLPRTR